MNVHTQTTRLNAVAAEADAVDDVPGDTSTTEVLDVAAPVTGTIDVFGDQDWYRFQVQTGTMCVFDLEGADTGGGDLGDTYLRLFDSVGNLIAEDDDSGVGFNSQIAFFAEIAETIFVSAGPYADNSTGTFTLRATEVVGDVPSNIETTAILGVDEPVLGTIDYANDSDCYRFRPVAGSTYVFELDDPDQFIFLLGSSGETLELELGKVGYIADTDNEIFVAVQAAASAPQDFQLTARQLVNDVPGGSITTRTLTTDRPVSGVIDFPTDQDWYRLEVEAGVTYLVRFGPLSGNEGSLFYSGVSLLDRDGNRLASGYAETAYTAGRSGEIFVAVDGSRLPFTRFRLSATETADGATTNDDSLVGTPADDTVLLLAGDDIARGYGGDDLLWGGAGDDTLYGGDGADVLDGGGQDGNDDTLYGGAGNDTFVGELPNFGAPPENDTIYGGNGADRVEYSAAVFYGGRGSDFALAEWGPGPANGDDRVLDGTETVFGGAGDDTLGGSDNGRVHGGDGDDLLYAGAERFGGEGDDVLLGDYGERPEVGPVHERLFGGDGRDRADGGLGVDALFGGAGADRLLGGFDEEGAEGDLLYGGTGNDALLGEYDGDTLFGGDGVDICRGGYGSDALFGGASADWLFGGSNNDRFGGGLGNDTITGGAGSDRFVFVSEGFGTDVIVDLESRDTIDIWASMSVDGIGTNTVVLRNSAGDVMGRIISLAGEFEEGSFI